MKFSEVEEWKIPYVNPVDGETVIKEALMVSSDVNGVIWRKKIPISLLASPDDCGKINLPSGKYSYGLPISLTAIPNAGCEFLGWSTGESSPSMTYLVMKEDTVIASFGSIDPDLIDYWDSEETYLATGTWNPIYTKTLKSGRYLAILIGCGGNEFKVKDTKWTWYGEYGRFGTAGGGSGSYLSGLF